MLHVPRVPGFPASTCGKGFFHFAVLNGTGTAGTATYALAEPKGNGSGSVFGSGSNIKGNKKSQNSHFTKLSLSSQKYEFGIRDPRSGIRDQKKTYSGSRIQGSKRHRIPIRNTASNIEKARFCTTFSFEKLC
jgi:hypothetical protein